MPFPRIKVSDKEVDKATSDLYRIVNLLEKRVNAVQTGENIGPIPGQYRGVPVYLNHELAPIPQSGYVTIYYLHDQYDFLYMLFSDGSRHNVRIALDWEDI